MSKQGLPLLADLAAQYAEYLAFAKEQGWEPPLSVQEWYEQRDHDEDEPEVDPSDIAGK